MTSEEQMRDLGVWQLSTLSGQGDREMPEQNTQPHKLGVLPPKQTVENSIKGPAMMRGPRRFRSQKTWDGRRLKDKLSRGGNLPCSHSKRHCWASIWVYVLGPPHRCFLRSDRLGHSSLTNTRTVQLRLHHMTILTSAI